MKISLHKVSRAAAEHQHIQTQRGGFTTESLNTMLYGLQHHLPEGSMCLVVQPQGETRRLALPGYITAQPYGLKEGETALYSQHGQVLYFAEDGTAHLEAAGKISIHSDEEDLYSLLKDLLEAIKGLTTAQIDTQVNGGSVATSTGAQPIANAAGSNPGVGLNAQSTQKLDQLAQRLDKLLQQGEKPQSAQEQEEQREQERTAESQKEAEDNNEGEEQANSKQAIKYVSFDLEITG